MLVLAYCIQRVYKQQKSIAHCSGGWKSKIRATAKSGSGECPLAGYRLPTSHDILTGWMGLGSSVKKSWKGQLLSRVQLFESSWTAALQAPLSMDFSRQEYWSGSPFSSPENLPNPGNEPGSPASRVDSSLSGPAEKPLGALWGFFIRGPVPLRKAGLIPP